MITNKYVHTMDETTALSNPVQWVVTTTDSDPNLILPFKGDYYVELLILSAKASIKDIKQYERDMKDYEKEIQRVQNLGMNSDIDEPDEPDMEVSYRKQWWNVSDKIIHSWYEEWDQERDCAIIVIEYSYSGVLDQINIKCTKTEWMNLLNKLGAIHL